MPSSSIYSAVRMLEVTYKVVIRPRFCVRYFVAQINMSKIKENPRSRYRCSSSCHCHLRIVHNSNIAYIKCRVLRVCYSRWKERMRPEDAQARAYNVYRPGKRPGFGHSMIRSLALARSPFLLHDNSHSMHALDSPSFTTPRHQIRTLADKHTFKFPPCSLTSSIRSSLEVYRVAAAASP